MSQDDDDDDDDGDDDDVNNNNSLSLLNIYNMPGVVLNSLRILILHNNN